MRALKENKRIFPLIGAVIVFVLVFCVLYLGDNVGLSDNGDFRRVMLVSNLKYENDDNYYYLFKRDYKMEIEGDNFGEKIAYLCSDNGAEEIYSSPQFVIIKASKVMNFLINTVFRRDESHYDIGCLAFIYTLLLSLAAWGIFTFFADSKRRIRIAVFIIFIVMFCDTGYILYFNSFYGEPLQYVMFMLLIALGLLIYKRPTIPKVICFFVSLYFFAGAKVANVPYAIIVSFLALAFAFLRKERAYRIGVAASGLAAVVCIAGLYVSIPDWMNEANTYHAVFFGALKETETPERDLRELGIDDKYAPLINTNSYMQEDEYPIDIKTDEFREDFYEKVNVLDIALFYMRHPIRFFGKVAFAIENAPYLQPLYLGTSETVIMDSTNRFSLWSHLRVAAKYPYNPPIVFAIALLLTAYVALATVFLVRKRHKMNAKWLYIIMAMYIFLAGLWISMCLPVIGNGEADIMKHMFLFENFMDLLTAGIILGIVNMCRRSAIISVAAMAAVITALHISRPMETLEFGTYNGKPVRWEIMSTDTDGTKTLVTKQCVEQLAFDDLSNMWEKSDLREWLNSDFVREFTPDELARIVPVKNEIMLAYDDRFMAESGDHMHIWNATRKSAADLSETAYKYTVEDMVYIPTLDMMSTIDVNGSYWVLCMYGFNNKMQRYMNSDGFVLNANVDDTKGVRAVIKISPSASGRTE